MGTGNGLGNPEAAATRTRQRLGSADTVRPATDTEQGHQDALALARARVNTRPLLALALLDTIEDAEAAGLDTTQLHHERELALAWDTARRKRMDPWRALLARAVRAGKVHRPSLGDAPRDLCVHSQVLGLTCPACGGTAVNVAAMTKSGR